MSDEFPLGNILRITFYDIIITENIKIARMHFKYIYYIKDSIISYKDIWQLDANFS